MALICCRVGIWHVKNALKKPFLETTEAEFKDSIDQCELPFLLFPRLDLIALKE